MTFTAYVRQQSLPITYIDARLEGSGYTVSTSGANYTKLYLNANWTNPLVDLGGANLIIIKRMGNFPNSVNAGGLILSGDALPYEMESPGVFLDIRRNDSDVAVEYHRYTHYRSVITDTEYNLDGSGNPTTVKSVKYFIHLAVPLLQEVGAGSEFIIIKQNEDVVPLVSSQGIVDLRRYISDMTWTTDIRMGYDTATIELNESASILGRYYSYFLGQNLEISDIYGNICWNGIITSVYIDGGGGRIDAVGYKHTMEWFRFDKIYAAPSEGWSISIPGPTSSQILHDVTLMNPYIKRFFTSLASPSSSGTHWGIKGYTASGTGESWPDAQLAETSYIGLDEIDFSDGSFKCSDAIESVESFGYAYPNETGFAKDSVFVQCWRDGYCSIKRVRKEPTVLVPDYIISRKNLQANNRGVEIAGDINNIVTETYVMYTESDGESNVSSSTYNTNLARKYGMRLRIESTDFGPSLAALIGRAATDDKSLVIGIGSVQLVGKVKGGRGQLNNVPVYLLKAGSIVEFEQNIGHASLYRNKEGTPGIFYIGSTSYTMSSGQLSITPAETLSAVDMFMKRQSRLTN